MNWSFLGSFFICAWKDFSGRDKSLEPENFLRIVPNYVNSAAYSVKNKWVLKSK